MDKKSEDRKVQCEDSSMATATKLDGGKPKLSLLHHALTWAIIPAGKDEMIHITSAIGYLSVAAHVTNDMDFWVNVNCAVKEIVKFIGSPEDAMVAATRAMEYGASKPEYGRNNWKKGFEWSRLIDAAMRHGLAITSGEVIDKDSGNEHVAHMLGAINMLLGNRDMNIGVNDIY